MIICPWFPNQIQRFEMMNPAEKLVKLSGHQELPDPGPGQRGTELVLLLRQVEHLVPGRGHPSTSSQPGPVIGGWLVTWYKYWAVIGSHQLLTNLRPLVNNPSNNELSGKLSGCSPFNANCLLWAPEIKDTNYFIFIITMSLKTTVETKFSRICELS